MALGKRLINTGGVAACTTDSADPFGDSSGVALYNLDYDASDASGSYDGTPTDVTFGVGGQINTGVRYSASTASTITTPLSSSDLATNFSVSFWIKLDGLSFQAFNGLYSKSPISNQGWFFGTRDSGGGNYRFFWLWYYDTSQNYNYVQGDNINLATDTFYHVALSFTNGSLPTLYVNGVASNSHLNSTTTAPVYNAGSVFQMGSTPNTNLGAGVTDQVRIFNKALDSTEVGTLFAETACVYTATTDIVNYPTGTTPVAYYKLDNSSEDYSTGGNDGTDTNIEYRFGRYGQAAVFNGTNSSISTPITSSDIGTSFTISCWVNADAASDNFHVPIGNYSLSGGWYMAMLNNMKFNFYSSVGGIDFSTTATYEYGNWYHFCVVFTNNSDLKVFINGDKETNSQSVAAGTSTAGIQIGVSGTYSSSTNTEFDGKIDQVRIYDTALTDSQVTELYNEKPETDTSNFKTVLWEGDGGTQYISNVGMDLETDGGLVWIKSRSLAASNGIYDSVRGVANWLRSDGPDAEQYQRTTGYLNSFDSNGFTLVEGSSTHSTFTGSYETHQSGETYVAWVWKGGGDAVTNNDGTNIISQVSANTEAGFSIVTYTGASGSVGHGLGTTPQIIIQKRLDTSEDWYTYIPPGVIDSTSNYYYLLLNGTDAKATTGSTPPTSTTFNPVSTSGGNYVAYCFHSVSGYSKIGVYEGNTTTLPSISLGFAPAFILFKRTDGADRWLIADTKRADALTNMDDFLDAQDSSGESTFGATNGINFLSDGFSINTTDGVLNANGGDYLYIAFK